MTEPADAYTSKSPDAGRLGKAAEYLVAAVCILATRGRLNVSTSIVDDEGIDLVFHLRESTATLAPGEGPHDRRVDGPEGAVPGVRSLADLSAPR